MSDPRQTHTIAYCHDYGPTRATVFALRGTDAFAQLDSLDRARELPAGLGLERVPVDAVVGDRIWA